MDANTTTTNANENAQNTTIEGGQKQPTTFSLMFIIILVIMAIFKMSGNTGDSNTYMLICVILVLILSLNSFQVGRDVYMLVFILGLIALTISTKEGVAIIENLGILRCEVLLVTAILLISMLLINMNNWNMEPRKGSEVLKEVRIEGFETIEGDATKSFCEKYQPDPNEMNKQCGKFDKNSCDIPSCCVWLNGKKCVAGDVNGPTFVTGEDMKEIDIKYYKHQGKCYGNCKENK
jgi:hypothetical protein